MWMRRYFILDFILEVFSFTSGVGDHQQNGWWKKN